MFEGEDKAAGGIPGEGDMFPCAAPPPPLPRPPNSTPHPQNTLSPPRGPEPDQIIPACKGVSKPALSINRGIFVRAGGCESRIVPLLLASELRML